MEVRSKYLVKPLVTPTVSIGSVNVSKKPSADIVGSFPDFKLNLVLPSGETGLQGPQGLPGLDGLHGLNGSPGVTGLQSMTLSVPESGIITWVFPRPYVLAPQVSVTPTSSNLCLISNIVDLTYTEITIKVLELKSFPDNLASLLNFKLFDVPGKYTELSVIAVGTFI